MTRAIVVILLLAGCQAIPQRAPAPPAITEAKIPVAVACVDASTVDPLPTTSMPARTAGPDALAAGAAADLIVWRERARLLREQLLACAGAPKVTK